MPGPTRESFKPIVLPNAEPVCPAGLPVSLTATGSGCHCRIEDHTLTTATEPSALAAYCFGAYTECPTWRRDKEHIWVERTNRNLLGSDGDLRTGHPEDAPPETDPESEWWRG